MSEITSRILKTESVKWRTLKWLQGELKTISKNDMGKLKTSLLKNSFIMPFHVWENGEQWILDGHHRQTAMNELEKEGHTIPDELPANFVQCANRKDAAKLVLVYSSIYAEATNESLGQFIGDFDLDIGELKLEIDMPNINLDRVSDGFLSGSVILNPTFEVVVECESEKEQEEKYNSLMSAGYRCRLLTL